MERICRNCIYYGIYDDVCVNLDSDKVGVTWAENSCSEWEEEWAVAEASYYRGKWRRRKEEQ